MKCKNCGNEFDAKTVTQKYCCKKCGREYRKNNPINDDYPSRTFTCVRCGIEVVTEGGISDRRTRFCSRNCERAYWKHPH